MIYKKRKILTGLVLGAMSIGFASQGFAAEIVNDDKIFDMEEYVVTANRMPVKANEVAAAVTVIDQATIERGNYSTVSDVLRSNNVNMSTTSFASYPVLNGDSRVLVLVNGRKMNWSHLVVSGDDNAINIDSLPVKNIERIEIVRGPNSALYGSNAVGGVINIITKKPVAAASTTVNTEFGTWNSQRYTLTTQGGDDDVRYLFSYDKQKRDNYEYKNAVTGHEKEFPYSNIDKEYESLRLDKSFGADTLSFELERSKQNDGHGLYLTNPEIPTVYGDGTPLQTTDLNFALTYTWKDGGSSGAGDYLRLYRNNEKSDTSFAGAPYEHDLTTLGTQWQKSWKLNNKNSLIGGAEYISEDINETNSGAIFQRGANMTSIYAEDHWTLIDGWSLNFGTRYENHSDFGGDFTSHVAINKVLSPQTNAYLSWGQAINNPTLKQRYANSPYWIGNPNLKQEKSETVTLGLNSQIDKKTNVQASIYSSKLDNALDWVWDTNISKTVYYNINREKRRGLELNTTHKFSDRWSLNTGYSYSRIEKNVGDNGQYTDYMYNSRPNGYSIGIQYTQDKWNADLTTQQVTGRNTKVYTDTSYTTVNLNLGYQFNDKTKAYIKGYNLTNEGYEILSSSAGRGAYAMPGRYFVFGVERKF